MKITLRLIISLIVVAALVASIFSLLQVRNERERLVKELEQQAIILAESLQESVKDRQFTGAAQELPDALIVNPYDIEEMAEAVRNALTMSHEERSKRMRRLREVVKERNVYRWAANLVITLSKLRLSKTTELEALMK
jgi:trehalose-6-phosphate synthase